MQLGKVFLGSNTGGAGSDAVIDNDDSGLFPAVKSATGETLFLLTSIIPITQH